MTAATTELPPGLRPWTDSLAFLHADAAIHLGPLVRRLDALVRRHDAVVGEQGDPDGYGGLTTRGHPDQLLLSEWLLAEELPLEFIRRAANRELLHIKPVAREPQPKGRVVAFFDVGLDQLGAARLVQLAALIVLHRRAAVRGSELVIGLSNEPDDRWHDGELPEQFTAWRRAQRADHTPAAVLAARDGQVEVDDELWTFAGPALAAQCGDRRLLVATRESAWDEHGATAVDVRFERRTTTFALPTGPLSIQTLRGAALRRTRRGAPTATDAALSCPSFPGADRRLLLRGDSADRIVVAGIPTNATGGEGRPRSHRFPGPVVAASSLGKRLVALTLVGDEVQVHTIGKRLSRLQDLAVPIADLGLTVDDLVHDQIAATLPPLFYDRGALLVQLNGTWWELRRGSKPFRPPELIAAGPGHALDIPRRLALVESTLRDDDDRNHIIGYDIVADALRVVTGDRAIAWSCDRRWHVRGHRVEPASITIDDSEVVLGLLRIDRDDPALVTRSPSGVLIRSHAESGSRTLTAASGPAVGHALHPILPLLAVQRDDELVEIYDLALSERISTVRAQ